MGICELVGGYIVPLGLTAVVLLVAGAFVALLLQRVAGRRLPSFPVLAGVYLGALLLVGGLVVFVDRARGEERVRERDATDVRSLTNLVANPLFTDFIATGTLQPASWAISGTVELYGPSDGSLGSVRVGPQSSLTSNMITVWPGATYRYSVYTDIPDDSMTGQAQVRLLWYDSSLNVLRWDDTPVWDEQGAVFTPPDPPAFHTGAYVAPQGAARLRLELRNLSTLYEDYPVSNSIIWFSQPKISQDGVYIEQHPNGAQGSLAFSFDWESAMGGAIHSRGMEAHDPTGAAQHGLDMREGADWLADLFAANAIRATFYGTGYNLLDGNTERRTFADDPIYDWASPANRWSSDYWLTHKWYGDDPYGTYETHPAWYFGDQTRRLAEAGHEIASHTFGHLYVRGATPEQLASDADEWNAAARAMGVVTPTTFAFPWRSSNSLTPEFYDVFYERGIRAVTRIYPLDVKDQYTIGAVGVYSDVAVMPDFLLGTPSESMDDEAGGGGISMEDGLRVLAEIGRRRGTTSFWQHPEQLADRPEFEEVREAWSVVVGAAARERDRGRLWIGTVAEITAYQRDLIGVSATLECGLGGWKVRINNALDRPISGVTLTLPGDAKRAASSEVGVSTVYHPEAGVTRVTSPGQRQYPARQLVLNDLKPGTATIDVDWVSGQEPLR